LLPALPSVTRPSAFCLHPSFALICGLVSSRGRPLRPDVAAFNFLQPALAFLTPLCFLCSLWPHYSSPLSAVSWSALPNPLCPLWQKVVFWLALFLSPNSAFIRVICGSLVSVLRSFASWREISLCLYGACLAAFSLRSLCSLWPVFCPLLSTSCFTASSADRISLVQILFASFASPRFNLFCLYSWTACRSGRPVGRTR